MNGEEALARVGRIVTDVIVSDIGMPEMDGYTLLRQVRGRRRRSKSCSPVRGVAPGGAAATRCICVETVYPYPLPGGCCPMSSPVVALRLCPHPPLGGVCCVIVGPVRRGCREAGFPPFAE